MLRYFKRWFPAKDELTKPGAASKQAIEMLRREYTGPALLEENVLKNPTDQFRLWFDEAMKVIKDDPNAMIVSTADEHGRPSSRTVLLKGFDENGFVFYTNYGSRKGKHIEKNPNVSIIFYWPELMRQVHIEGSAVKTSAEQSDAYFAVRPEASKIAAWATAQSTMVDSREVFEQKRNELEKNYKGKEIPRPPYWGGYIVVPCRFEFWQGRLNRLHDRICYTHDSKQWNTQRLSP